MSKSYKKNLILKGNGNHRKDYHKLTRKSTKQKIREIPLLEDIDDFELKLPKSIIDDYDYIDYAVKYDESSDPEGKYKRKFKNK